LKPISDSGLAIPALITCKPKESRYLGILINSFYPAYPLLTLPLLV
jgi:hypothetical protein